MLPEVVRMTSFIARDAYICYPAHVLLDSIGSRAGSSPVIDRNGGKGPKNARGTSLQIELYQYPFTPCDLSADRLLRSAPPPLESPAPAWRVRHP